MVMHSYNPLAVVPSAIPNMWSKRFGGSMLHSSVCVVGAQTLVLPTLTVVSRN